MEDFHLFLMCLIVFLGPCCVMQEVSVKKKGAANAKLPLSCDDAYMDDSQKTVCLSENPDVTTTGVKDADKHDIVVMHNQIRSMVAPPAADMQKMKWDVNLAAMAQLWADQCLNDHDLLTNYAEYGESVGQNIASGMTNWKEAIDSWERESKRFVYGSDPDVYLGKFGWLKVRHYALMVHSKSVLVGCGYAACLGGDHNRFFVCNYLSGYGKTDDSKNSWLEHPYTFGPSCSSCSNVCKDNMCDCDGRYCFHGGSLNMTTCECRCDPAYTGAECRTPRCEEGDSDACYTDWTPTDCAYYPDARDDCPHMCGVCEGEDDNDMDDNETDLDGVDDLDGLSDIVDDLSDTEDQSDIGEDQADIGNQQPYSDAGDASDIGGTSNAQKNHRPKLPDIGGSHNISDFNAAGNGLRNSSANDDLLNFDDDLTAQGNSSVKCDKPHDTASPGLCTSMGIRGRDTPECRTQGGMFSCEHCVVPAVMFLNCPVMCGLCGHV